MATWDPEAEEEFYQCRIDNITSQLRWHLQTCLSCEGTSAPRCLHGFEIQEELDILTEDLRKVKLKNRMY